jgi:hypothetical protein
MIAAYSNRNFLGLCKLVQLIPGSRKYASEEKELVTRQERIDDFIHDERPPANKLLQVLCEDHNGTYLLPFLCQWRDGVWQNAKSNRRIEAAVVGWRAPEQVQR